MAAPLWRAGRGSPARHPRAKEGGKEVEDTVVAAEVDPDLEGDHEDPDCLGEPGWRKMPREEDFDRVGPVERRDEESPERWYMVCEAGRTGCRQKALRSAWLRVKGMEQYYRLVWGGP